MKNCFLPIFFVLLFSKFVNIQFCAQWDAIPAEVVFIIINFLFISSLWYNIIYLTFLYLDLTPSQHCLPFPSNPPLWRLREWVVGVMLVDGRWRPPGERYTSPYLHHKGMWQDKLTLAPGSAGIHQSYAQESCWVLTQLFWLCICQESEIQNNMV